jgi:lauroyl/myristoyl acyltransferase
MSHRDERTDELFLKRRRAYGVRVIPLKQAVRPALRVLGKNEVVAMNGDRLFGSAGFGTKFFGQDALLPRGPVFLSRKSGAPIVGCISLPAGEGQYHIRLMEPIYPERLSEEENCRAFTALVESIIRSNLHQWFAFEDIFRNGVHGR